MKCLNPGRRNEKEPSSREHVTLVDFFIEPTVIVEVHRSVIQWIPVGSSMVNDNRSASEIAEVGGALGGAFPGAEVRFCQFACFLKNIVLFYIYSYTVTLYIPGIHNVQTCDTPSILNLGKPFIINVIIKEILEHSINRFNKQAHLVQSGTV